MLVNLDRVNMESVFKKYRPMVLGYYGTAAWLRQLILSMWNGAAYQVELSRIACIDSDHAQAVFDMLLSYREHGRNDREFMILAQECQDRLNEEMASDKRQEDLRRWVVNAENAVRSLGVRSDFIEDHYGWFESRFNAGIGAGEAVREALSAKLP